LTTSMASDRLNGNCQVNSIGKARMVCNTSAIEGNSADLVIIADVNRQLRALRSCIKHD